ncbi:hypothetical protein [Aliivibrio fischeri]|uniref:Uncharacterized protein n=1 Tax=Aliivibrio fischeri TaxID=668 RepID=A0A510UNP9_ALIFS|nr:hypothetical protein [Aliivibrio fischeri]MUK51570.1 hypothetical protein [Aliivibrio fischeri]GEK16264.1 hypothetical protein AFI02nite_43000 [Aliivibrio fischeri]
MKSEFQRQLEALGFEKIQAPLKQLQENKTKPIVKKNKKVSKSTSLILKSDKDKRFRKRKVIQTTPLTKMEAKAILERLHSDNKSWGTQEFATAYKLLTRRNTILSYEQSKDIIRRWHRFESRVYELDYSIALFIISGIWISPLPRLKEGMSKQVKARCERRDINGSYNVWVYKN